MITGETGAGKTMVVTALGLLLGGRADSGAVRSGADAARVEGSSRVGDAPRVRGGRRGGRRRGRGRPGRAGAQRLGRGAVAGVRRAAPRCPVSVLAGGGRAAGRRARPVRPAPAAAAPRPARRARPVRRRARWPSRWRDYVDLRARLLATEAELAEVTARPASGPARPTCCGSGSTRSRPSSRARARTPSWPPRRPGSGTPTRCGRPPRRARGAVERAGGPDALAAAAVARTAAESVRDHDTEAGDLADRLAELTYLLSDLAADVASYASGLETDPARLAAVSERRAALTALTRKYGDTIAEVLAWSEQSAARLLDLDDTDGRIERLRASSARLRADLGDHRRRADQGPRRRRHEAGHRGDRGTHPAGHAGRPTDRRGRRPRARSREAARER